MEPIISDTKIYPVPTDFAANAHINEARYNDMYQRSVDDPEEFWAEQAASELDWFKPWDKVLDGSYEGNVNIKWFEGGKLNVAYNCIDRHLESRGDQVAIIWEGDDPNDDKKITYKELHEEVSKFSNLLKSRGVNKGDRVCIYMPMVPEAAYAMLACARIGAVHSVVFGGISPELLKDRIQNSDCRVVITADEGVRGGRPVPLKTNTDRALEECPNVHSVIVVKRTGGNVGWYEGRDIWYHVGMQEMSLIP